MDMGQVKEKNIAPGIDHREETIDGYNVSTVNISTMEGGILLNRIPGTYTTINIGKHLNALEEYEPLITCTSKVLTQMLQPYFEGRLLICGVGNKSRSFDALGPEVLSNLPLYFLSTKEAPVKVRKFKDVCGIIPGVVWNNNIPTDKLLAAIVQQVHADCALFIDSCATGNAESLCKTIQISAGGLIFDERRKFNQEILGVPVITLGVPTAIKLPELSGKENDLFTSANVHEMVSVAGTILAASIMKTCWPDISIADCVYLSKCGNDALPAEWWGPAPIEKEDFPSTSFAGKGIAYLKKLF